jgi:hypothetical protein
MGRACSTNGERNAYKISVGNPAGKIPIGRLNRSLVDKNKIDFRVIG